MQADQRAGCAEFRRGYLQGPVPHAGNLQYIPLKGARAEREKPLFIADRAVPGPRHNGGIGYGFPGFGVQDPKRHLLGRCRDDEAYQQDKSKLAHTCGFYY